MDKAFRKLVSPEIPLTRYPAAMRMRVDLMWEWVQFLNKYRRHSNFLFSYIQHGPQFAAEYTHQRIQKNYDVISSWIDDAKDSFRKTQVSFFWKCKVLSRVERPKHWRPASFSKQRIQRESQQYDEGIFVPSMSVRFLIQGLWCIFAVQFKAVRGRRLRFAALDYGSVIGYAKGNPVSTVRYDIDYSAVHAHAYPIMPDEVKDYPLVTLEELNMEMRHISGLKGEN